MPMSQLNTRWQPNELFTQTMMTISNDPHWMVQNQTDQALILQRDPTFGPGRWLILIGYVLLVIATIGIALLLLPLLGFLFIGRTTQQITINTRPATGGHTLVTFNYTNGARRVVQAIISIAPGP